MDEVRVWQGYDRTLWELKKSGERYQGGGHFKRGVAIESAARLAVSFGVQLVIDDEVVDANLVLERLSTLRSIQTG